MDKLMPSFRYKGVQYIDLKKLKEKNVEGILLDVDNTLIDYKLYLHDDVKKWVTMAKESRI